MINNKFDIGQEVWCNSDNYNFNPCSGTITTITTDGKKYWYKVKHDSNIATSDMTYDESELSKCENLKEKYFVNGSVLVCRNKNIYWISYEWRDTLINMEDGVGYMPMNRYHDDMTHILYTDFDIMTVKQVINGEFITIWEREVVYGRKD